MFVIGNIVYLAILLLLGACILIVRRGANGSRSGYKLLLVMLGLLLGMWTSSGSAVFRFDNRFLEAVSIMLLVILLFELSTRLRQGNIKLDSSSLWMFILLLGINIVVIGLLSAIFLRIYFIHAIMLAIIMSSIEYFMVDELRSEGDLANPLILFFAFSIVAFYSLTSDIGGIFGNITYFLEYMLIGLAMGVFVGIIVFKILRDRTIDGFHELGLVAVALATYLVTEQLSGSGLFAVFILGLFFGNSYVRKTSRLQYGFSPFIFKSLEMLIFLMIGFCMHLVLSLEIALISLAIFAAYILIRLLIMHIFFKHYSIENKLLLSLAPKGMILGVTIVVLGAFGAVESTLLSVMLLILVYSLVCGVVLERIEAKKEFRLDKVYDALLHIRFGRKRDLSSAKRWHTYYK